MQIDDFMQDSGISSPNLLEIQQFCTKPPKWHVIIAGD